MLTDYTGSSFEILADKNMLPIRKQIGSLIKLILRRLPNNPENALSSVSRKRTYHA